MLQSGAEVAAQQLECEPSDQEVVGSLKFLALKFSS